MRAASRPSRRASGRHAHVRGVAIGVSAVTSSTRRAPPSSGCRRAPAAPSRSCCSRSRWLPSGALGRSEPAQASAEVRPARRCSGGTDPLTFWSSNQRPNFAVALDRKESSRRHRTAISPSLSEGLERMISDGHAKLLELRERHTDAALLVVCETIEHAQGAARIAERICGQPPVVVTSDDPGGDAPARGVQVRR